MEARAGWPAGQGRNGHSRGPRSSLWRSAWAPARTLWLLNSPHPPAPGPAPPGRRRVGSLPQRGHLGPSSPGLFGFRVTPDDLRVGSLRRLHGDTWCWQGLCAPTLPPAHREATLRSQGPARHRRLDLVLLARRGRGQPLPGCSGCVHGQSLGASEGLGCCQPRRPNRPSRVILEIQHQMQTHQTERYLAFVSDYKIRKR